MRSTWIASQHWDAWSAWINSIDIAFTWCKCYWNLIQNILKNVHFALFSLVHFDVKNLPIFVDGDEYTHNSLLWTKRNWLARLIFNLCVKINCSFVMESSEGTLVTDVLYFELGVQLHFGTQEIPSIVAWSSCPLKWSSSVTSTVELNSTWGVPCWSSSWYGYMTVWLAFPLMVGRTAC